jgi:GT2 family glycosyltransferase
LSRLNLLEESRFLRDNRALLVPPPQDPLCVGSPACATNNRPDHVKLVPSNKISRCANISQCLTVVTKTARRPLLVLRMAQSIRDTEGFDLPIIAYDDGPGNYSEDVWGEIQRFPDLRYVITNDDDLGISKGRNLAIKEVKTKYFMLVDDDNVFNKYTKLKKMIKILDTTDAALVGGKFTNYRDYSGMMQVSIKNEKAVLTLYMGSCVEANQTIVNFPECVRCDLTSNVFIAKTDTILDVGGWSEELKVGEHKDIFLKLKTLGHKVVYCPKFQVFNKKPSQKGELNVKGFSELRKGVRLNRMKRLIAHRWNIEKIVEKKAIYFNFNLLSKKPSEDKKRK